MDIIVYVFFGLLIFIMIVCLLSAMGRCHDMKEKERDKNNIKHSQGGGLEPW